MAASLCPPHPHSPKQADYVMWSASQNSIPLSPRSADDAFWQPPSELSVFLFHPSRLTLLYKLMNEITPRASESRDGGWYFAGSKLKGKKKKGQRRIWARATFLSAGDARHDADAALPTPMTSTWWKLKTQLTIHPRQPVKLELCNKFRSHPSAWLCFKNVLISRDTFLGLKFTTHHVSILSNHD